MTVRCATEARIPFNSGGQRASRSNAAERTPSNTHIHMLGSDSETTCIPNRNIMVNKTQAKCLRLRLLTKAHARGTPYECFGHGICCGQHQARQTTPPCGESPLPSSLLPFFPYGAVSSNSGEVITSAHSSSRLVYRKRASFRGGQNETTCGHAPQAQKQYI